jgi:hypothetical protein
LLHEAASEAKPDSLSSGVTVRLPTRFVAKAWGRRIAPPSASRTLVTADARIPAQWSANRFGIEFDPPTIH